MKIHPTAIIDPTARLGKDVEIGPYVMIGPGVVLGDRCRIISHAALEYIELGADCVVYPQASLGFAPQHLSDPGIGTKAVAGDRCVFREGVTVHRGTKLQAGLTVIGNDCYFMALSHVAHDCVVGNNVIMANAAQLAGHVQVGDRCFISATVGIHQWCRIGALAILSGGAMSSQDVPPFAMAQGDRATIRGINVIGMRRAKFSREAISAVKDAYRTIFYSGLSLQEALQSPDLKLNDEGVKILVDFLKTAKRGFIRPAATASMEEQEALA